VKESVVKGKDEAAKGARKLKKPAIATGAVLAAGAAAVVASKAGSGKTKVLGVSVPKGKTVKGGVRSAVGAVADAAGQAEEIGERITKVAESVQSVSKAADKAAKKA
jgi:hypothetical protein